MSGTGGGSVWGRRFFALWRGAARRYAGVQKKPPGFPIAGNPGALPLL